MITWVLAWIWARDDGCITTRNRHLISIEHSTTITRLKRHRAGGMPVLPEGDEETTLADYITTTHIAGWKDYTVAEKEATIAGDPKLCYALWMAFVDLVAAVTVVGDEARHHLSGSERYTSFRCEPRKEMWKEAEHRIERHAGTDSGQVRTGSGSTNSLGRDG